MRLLSNVQVTATLNYPFQISTAVDNDIAQKGFAISYWLYLNNMETWEAKDVSFL